MIFVIDDDLVMAKCVGRAIRKAGKDFRVFSNAIEAISAVDEELPEMIFLDILLTGPDGFTFLNEMASYSDTAKIPVVVVSSLSLYEKDLSPYGVVEVLNKEKMTPEKITNLALRYTGGGDE